MDGTGTKGQGGESHPQCHRVEAGMGEERELPAPTHLPSKPPTQGHQPGEQAGYSGKDCLNHMGLGKALPLRALVSLSAETRVNATCPCRTEVRMNEKHSRVLIRRHKS